MWAPRSDRPQPRQRARIPGRCAVRCRQRSVRNSELLNVWRVSATAATAGSPHEFIRPLHAILQPGSNHVMLRQRRPEARFQPQGRKPYGLAKRLCVAPAQGFKASPAFAIAHGTTVATLTFPLAAFRVDSRLQHGRTGTERGRTRLRMLLPMVPLSEYPSWRP